MKTLYPEIQPFLSFFLETDSQHRVYVEQSGNPDGIPVIFLHGGPCSGTKPHHRQFFNPQRYHIILFDQRGCGLSLPFGELENNTTQDLCADIERIRTQLNIKQWLVFGGSWGGALALYYAQQHTDKVLGLIIRAVFLARQRDLEWFAKDGVGRIYPEQWQRLIASIPNASHHNLVEDCYEALWSKDEVTQRRVAKEWLAWGAQVALGNDYQPTDEAISEKTLKQARMELHYAKHCYFIDENQLLANCQLLTSISTVIIHGRRDLVCPIEAGLSLHQALPHADYIILPNAGHIAQGADMIDALVSATDCFAENHTRLN
ncbi:MAG: prolyl aminopeptidase [Methylococcales bacterium]